MFKQIKNILRKVLFSAGIDITKNQQYDRLTLAIMKKVLKENSGCIDIGCHKGEVLDEMIKYAPKGRHTGFEPIPEYYHFLGKKYGNLPTITIKQVALSDHQGKVSFNWVKNAPAYSGLEQREYATKAPVIEKIEVDAAKLDDYIDEIPATHLIKIDVEGAEMKVLEGAKEFILKYRPTIIFECGQGAADYYGTTPEMVYHYFESKNYSIYNLKDFLNNGKPFDESSFSNTFNNKIEYYFVATPNL